MFEQRWPKFHKSERWEDRTNMDMILLLLPKPVDKRVTTLVHITYSPLINRSGATYSFYRVGRDTFKIPHPENKCSIYPPLSCFGRHPRPKPHHSFETSFTVTSQPINHPQNKSFDSTSGESRA